MELVDFLRARLDEDEALALEAPQGPWHIGNAVDPTQPCNVHTFPGARMVADGLNWLAAEHIARQNPARVLAEIEAKRRIIALHVKDKYYDGCVICDNGNNSCGCMSGWHWKYPCDTLKLLALPYASHPDYRDFWRP